MTSMLIASSPVEIEAKAGETGLSGEARDAALRLFHDLTSRIELDSPALDTPGGQDWPLHRFYFGPAGGEIAHLLDALRSGPQTAEVTGGSRRVENARALFASGTAGEYAGVLVACVDTNHLRALTALLEGAR